MSKNQINKIIKQFILLKKLHSKIIFQIHKNITEH